MAATAPPLTMPAAFLKAIIEEPGEDALRLIFADFLDEEGDHDRAELIRVGCELAHPIEALRRFVGDHGDRRLIFLRRRERELLEAHGHEWLPPSLDPAETRVLNLCTTDRSTPAGFVGVEYRRGFLDTVTLPCEAWCGRRCRACEVSGPDAGAYIGRCRVCRGTGRTGALGPALVRAAPLMEVRLSGKRPGEHSGDGRRWWVKEVPGEGPPPDVSYVLPACLFRLLLGGQPRRDDMRAYDDEAAALDALSAACLAWAKKEGDS